jgi:hypothetical protein
MSKLIIALVVVSFIVRISDGIARYIVNKQDENNDE